MGFRLIAILLFSIQFDRVLPSFFFYRPIYRGVVELYQPDTSKRGADGRERERESKGEGKEKQREREREKERNKTDETYKKRQKRKKKDKTTTTKKRTNGREFHAVPFTTMAARKAPTKGSARSKKKKKKKKENRRRTRLENYHGRRRTVYRCRPHRGSPLRVISSRRVPFEFFFSYLRFFFFSSFSTSSSSTSTWTTTTRTLFCFLLSVEVSFLFFHLSRFSSLIVGCFFLISCFFFWLWLGSPTIRVARRRGFPMPRSLAFCAPGFPGYLFFFF